MRGHELFLLNTSTLQLTSLMVPGENSPPPSTISGNWSADSIFREDDTHLLAWDVSSDYLNPSNSASAPGGLYRYDFTTQTLSRVISATSVPGADNHLLERPMRYSHGNLFYETMTFVGNSGVYGGTYDYTIYSHSLANPTQPSVQVLEGGRANFCSTPGTSSFNEPGWDISPDGAYLADQTFAGNDLTHLRSQVQLVDLRSGTKTPIFQQIAPQTLDRDITLTWSPDSQTVLLEGNASSQAMLCTESTSQEANVQCYTTNSVSQYGYYPVLWHTSSTAFALLHNDPSGNSPSQIYLFKEGQSNGELLLDSARNFAWGTNQ